jgi:CheY-like chemotaxis protein
LHLSRAWEVATATSGPLALEVLANEGPFAVVISDMGMPGMDGATLLRTIRQRFPDTVRILLTGHWALDAAMGAVNEGDCFRVITKPCPPQVFVSVVEAAVQQYGLITGERVLLEQTLCGTIEALTNVLMLTNPTAFGRAARITRLVRALVAELALTERWPVEAAAMMSQLGASVLAPDTAEKVYASEVLSETEREVLDRLPTLTEQMLKDIPRLEPVREILATYRACGTDAHAREAIAKYSVGARVLKVAVDLEDVERSGKTSRAAAVEALRGGDVEYDPRVLEALVAVSERQQQVRVLPLADLREGMVLADDVRTSAGTLVAVSGYRISAAFLERVKNLAVTEPLQVFDTR